MGHPEVLRALMRFCAYRERSPLEVYKKAKVLKAREEDFPGFFAVLESEGFLNETRYAMAYASDAFRLKQWGPEKIRYKLRLENIDEDLCQQAIDQFDSEAYTSLCVELLGKWKQDKLKPEADIFALKSKALRYLIGRGFPPDMASDVIWGADFSTSLLED